MPRTVLLYLGYNTVTSWDFKAKLIDLCQGAEIIEEIAQCEGICSLFR
jgi:hypothetical protein